MIEIDGSLGEGGGQIVRTACSLSTITGRPCRVFNIRQGVKAGGLRPQHLGAVRTLAEMSEADIDKAELGSPEIIFKPQKIKAGSYKTRIRTAGSVTLVLHTLLPAAISSDAETIVTIEGGATDTFFSPTINHFRLVFLEMARKMGVEARVSVDKRGFYPKGGALVEMTIRPSSLKSINLVEPGRLEKVTAYSGATTDLKKRKVAERQLSGLKQVLSALDLPLKENISYHHAEGTGSYLDIVVRTERSVLGTNALGKMGKSAEQVGQETAAGLLKEVRSQAPVDKHTGDQLLPYLALSGKRSRLRISALTEHALTNMKIIERFLPGRFETKEATVTWRPS